MSITAGLAVHGAARPQEVALACDGHAVTWSELDRMVGRVAAALASSPPGGIAIHLANGPALAVLFLAAARAGREAQILDPGWPPALAREVVAALRPAALFTADPDLPGGRVLDPAMGFEAVADAVGAPRATVPPPEPDPRLPFYVGFTSGSTGVPKGFRRDHASWTESFAADAREFGIGQDDVILAPGALTHSLFLYALAYGIHAGAKVVLCRRFRPNAIADLAARHGATVLYGVPTQLAVTLDALEAAGAALPRLRWVLSSGAKWFEAEGGRLRTLMPGARFGEFYGASETSFIAVAKDGEQVPPGAVGRAFSGVRIVIRDRSGRRVPTGKAGLVFVDSPFLFMGYALGGAQDVIRRGREMSVGDVGRLDAQGFLHLVGRAKRMIVTSGKNLYPEETERQLEHHPAVAAAAVFGIADPRRGERLLAVLHLRDGRTVTRAELIAFLRPSLPLFKIPRLYAGLGDWPLTASGKTDFGAVRALWPEGCEAIT